MKKDRNNRAAVEALSLYLTYLLQQRGLGKNGRWYGLKNYISPDGTSRGVKFSYIGPREDGLVMLRGNHHAEAPYYHALKQFSDITPEIIDRPGYKHPVSKDNPREVSDIFFEASAGELYEQAIKKPDWPLFVEHMKAKTVTQTR